MNITVQTIPELLVSTRGNQTEVMRILNSSRNTIRKYARDIEGKHHVVHNGFLMVKAVPKPRGKKRFEDG
jgi:hypothetical protein